MYPRNIEIIDLGLIKYGLFLKQQEIIFEQAKAGLFDSALIVCQHWPVITLGRQAVSSNILVDPVELESRNIKTYKINRGGDVTYHGLGQIMVYPVINLNFFKKDIHLFLRRLEDMVINFLSDFGINAEKKEKLTGVWIGNKKISSIGIAIKNWITFHGLSINIKKDDLAGFKLIRPCGMDIVMTSLESELGRKVEMEEIKESIVNRFVSRFEMLKA